MATTPVSRIVIRMYRIGTGDCLALKGFKGASTKPSFRMLIDCGSCRGDAAHFKPFLLGFRPANIDDQIFFFQSFCVGDFELFRNRAQRG